MLEPFALHRLVTDIAFLSLLVVSFALPRPCRNAADAAVAENGGGAFGDAGATKRADNKRRKRTTGRMPPCSEWRCVALFFNNTAAPADVTVSVASAGAGSGSSQGVPVPAAVNSLAWSSLEERLFTADTVGSVRVRISIGTPLTPVHVLVAGEIGSFAPSKA